MRTPNGHWNILFKEPVPFTNIYQTHIAELCEVHKINQKIWPRVGKTNLNGAAYPDQTILAPFVCDKETYLISIHEIGHVVTNSFHRNIDKIPFKQRQELTAWKWAKEHALIWDRECVMHADKALRSYQLMESQLFLRF